jgi:hypothetical protein
MMLVGVGAYFMWERRSKANLSTAMRLAQTESTALNERVDRLLGAWEVLWEHIELDTLLAEGSYASPMNPFCKLRPGWENFVIYDFSEHAPNVHLTDRIAWYQN